ncbi:MAG: hypothetical protein ACE361_12095 [Aureliella sp.]
MFSQTRRWVGKSYVFIPDFAGNNFSEYDRSMGKSNSQRNGLLENLKSPFPPVNTEVSLLAE